MCWVFPYSTYLLWLGIVVGLTSESYSWRGSWYLLDSISSSLLLLVVFTHGFLVLTRVSFRVLYTSSYLVALSLLFFCSSSLLHMYILLEAALVPLLVLLLGYGGQIEKVSASYYLIFYTSLCSLPFLVSYCSMDFGVHLPYSYSSSFTFCSLSLIFLVKFPLYSLHLWLPKVHVESPTEASVLLASLLLKMGSYGFVSLLPSRCWLLHQYIEVLCLLGLLVCSFLCCSARDTKTLVAYSSVVHISFICYLLLTCSGLSKNCSALLMVSHGYVSTILFYLVGELYGYWGTRTIYFSNSLWMGYPLLSILLLVSLLANAGCPPFIRFFGEVLGLSNILSSSLYMFVPLFLYFMITYYYSLRLGLSLLSGSSLSKVSTLIVVPLLPTLIVSTLFVSLLL